MAENRKSEIKTLDDLAEENCSVLFDTSVVVGPLGQNRRDLRLKGKIEFTEKNIEFLRDIIKYVENGSEFYITKPVLEEIDKGSFYTYKKAIKKGKARGNKILLKFRRLLVEEGKEKRKLVKCFKYNNKIINFDENEGVLLNRALEKYSDIQEKYELEDTDFDFLINGLTIAITSNPVDLLSNDYHIFYARNDVLQKINFRERKIYNKNFWGEDIRFFNRIGFLDFEELVMKQSYNRNSAVIPK